MNSSKITLWRLSIDRVVIALAAFITSIYGYGQPVSAVAPDIKITIGSPMAPPSWALLERALLQENTTACREFFDKYFELWRQACIFGHDFLIV